MVKINKKADLNMYLVAILVLVISYVVYINFFVLTNKQIVSQTDDLVCRAYVATKDLPISDISEFIYELNSRCKKDYINVKLNNKEEILDEIADLQKRCWYRYGEGKYDFMEHLGKDGNWCFECAEVDFNNDEFDAIYSYNEYIDYLKSKKMEVNDTQISYFSYMNLKYAYVDDVSKQYEIKSDIDDLIQEGDKNFQQLGLIYNEQYLYLNDLLKKQIDTSEKVYVVYRYDKPSHDYQEKATNAMITGTVTTLGIMTAPLIMSGITFLACTSTVITFGFTGPLCAISVTATAAKFASNVAKLGTKGYELIKKATKISEFIKDSIQYSRITKKAVKIFTGTISEIRELKKSVELENKVLSQNLENIAQVFEKYNIKHIDEVDDLLKDTVKYEANINDLFDANYKMLNSKGLKKLVARQDYYRERIVELKKVQEEIIEMEKQMSKIPTKTLGDKIMEKKVIIIKGTMAVTAGAIAASVAYNSNYNENQYVDILTQEQYYRLCGTKAYDLN